MFLRKRRKGKGAQALDALAGITKIWAQLEIGKKAGEGVAKVKKVRLPWLKSRRAKAAGAVVVAGGVGAVVAKKMKGDPTPVYTGPAPSEAVEAAAKAPDAPPPLAVAPDPDPAAGGIPAAGASALRDGGDEADAAKPAEPAAGSSALRDGAAADEAADKAAADEAAAAADEPAATPAEAAADDEPAVPIADDPAAEDPPAS